MQPVPVENVDRAGERSGHRRDKYRQAPVLELLDDEPRDQAVPGLDQRRLPHLLLAMPGQLLGEASKESEPGELGEERSLEALPGGPAGGGADGDTDDETDDQEEKQGEKVFRR